jgi:glycosyltransferase involved in cell wall biosynthesis
MLRVAFIDQTGSDSGGAQESFALLLRYLPPWIEPEVILFHEGAYAQRLRATGLSVRIFTIPPAIDSGKREHVSVLGIAAVPTSVMRLARRLKELQVNVVYTHTVKAHFIGAPAARLAGVPCVMHFRDILEGAASTALRTVASCCSKERIAISKSVADAFGLPSTHIVLNPVDPGTTTETPSRAQAAANLRIPVTDTPTIGIVGRINRWKGHDRFLRIARRIADRIDARFLVIGSAIFRDQDFAEELVRLAQQLRLQSQVYFIPWLVEMRDAYALLDVNCICSTREPFGRTCIEAAAYGVPTVCFADAGASEIIESGKDGIVVAGDDEDRFANEVCGLFASSDRLRVMRENARRLVALCAPNRHASSVANILAEAAA